MGRNKPGKPCGRNVDSCLAASSFRPGVSDRCASHRIDRLVAQAADPNCGQDTINDIESVLDHLLGDRCAAFPCHLPCLRAARPARKPPRPWG